MMAVLCLAATAAHAETIYKYRMPDGKILYTTETQARGTLLETMRDPPKPQPVDPARQNALREQSGQAKAANDRRLADLTAADAEVSAANRALQEAKARQTAGVEPAEGERIGTVRGGGRGRANEEYRERQRELQEAVDDAQRRLDEAYGKLNALK
jgi:hypothetical protein